MKQLEKFIHYLVNNIPYYMRYDAQIELEDLPIITKQIIRNNYDFFIATDISVEDREKILQILKGDFHKSNNSVNEVFQYKQYIFEETTGTSAVPFRVVKSEEERIRIGVEVWRRRRKIDPKASPKYLYRLNHTGINQTRLNPYNYEVENILNIYNTVDEENIRWLHVSPNPLQCHAFILQQYGKCHFDSLKFIECTGNFFTKEQSQLYSDIFGATVINQYGSIETWPIAYTCCNNRMHLLNNIIVELVDDNNVPITNYNEVGNIVITCLDLKTMPFVRYRIGDFGKFVKYDCSCGLTSPIIELIPGREVNIIKGCPQKIFGNVLFPKIIQGTARRLGLWDEIEFIQVHQVAECEFQVLMNFFDRGDEFIKKMEVISEKELMKKVRLLPVYLSEDEMQEKREEKPNVFLCKY